MAMPGKMVKKEKSEHSAEFAKGGNGHMFGPQAAEPQTSGHTADPSATDNAPGAQFANGGKGKMFGYMGSVPATAGKTSAR